mmetsp:Transcript_24169/g.50620  ORF Transcript_24169/g.50620 Transcript_24169/m.50620 type:complete len:424 (+) Transcript_24169:46-1317(+)
MSTTVVFACKSNSCRSQLAEGWAHEWIKAQRLGIEKRAEKARCGSSSRGDDVYDRQLSTFLDGLLVVSVALDESSVSSNHGRESILPPLSAAESSNSFPASTLATNDAAGSSTIPTATTKRQRQCVTCDGETCASSSSSLLQRRKPKEKAIQAMAQDGVDISSYYAKSFTEVLPHIVRNHRKLFRQNETIMNKQLLLDNNTKNWKQHLSFAGLCHMLESASREMGMAFAGVAREGDDRITSTSTSEGKQQELLKHYSSFSGLCRVLESASREMGMAFAGVAREEDERVIESSSAATTPEGTGVGRLELLRPIDNLRVLCSCPDSMKRQLTDLSKDALDWDIDPPTTAAKSEGDGAYLRVSRQIRGKVDSFMDELKRCALVNLVSDKEGGDFDHCSRHHLGLSEGPNLRMHDDAQLLSVPPVSM